MARRQIPMESGERDRYITIQQLTESKGSSGFPVEAWTTLVQMFAMKQDMNATERFRLDQLAAKSDTRWEINYRADMDPDLVDVPKSRRVLYQGRVYDIVAASQIGRLEGVELMTLAGSRI